VEGKAGILARQALVARALSIEIGDETFVLNVDHHARRPCAAPGFHQG
jgi:hypothetical protein